VPFRGQLLFSGINIDMTPARLAQQEQAELAKRLRRVSSAAFLP